MDGEHRETRRKALLDACKYVCCMCGGQALRFETDVIGPNLAGNYTHPYKDGGSPVLCAGSSIWSLINHEARKVDESRKAIREEVQKYQWDSAEEEREAEVIADRIIELVRKPFIEGSPTK